MPERSPGELIQENAESDGFKIRFAILVKYVKQAWSDGLAEMVKQKAIDQETANRFAPTESMVKDFLAAVNDSTSKSSLQKNTDIFFKTLGLNAPKIHLLIRPIIEAHISVWTFVQKPGGLEFPPVLDPKIKADFDRDPKNQDYLTQLMEITFRADAIIHLTRHIVAIYGDLEDLKKEFKDGASVDELNALKRKIIAWAESWLDEVANDRLMVRLNKKVSPKSYMLSAVVIDWVKKFKANIEESDPDSLADTIEDFLGDMDHLNSEENHYLYNEIAYEALALLNQFQEIVEPFESNPSNSWMRIMAKSIDRNKKLLQKHVSWPNVTANVRGVAGKKDISEYVRLRYFQGALINYGHWRSLDALTESGALAIYILKMDEQVDVLAKEVLAGDKPADADVYLSIVVRANTTRLLMAEAKFGGGKMNSAPIAPPDVYMAVREPFANWFFRSERAEYLNKFTVNTESSEALFTQVGQAKADFAASFAQSHEQEIEAFLQQGENLEIMLRNLVEENFEHLKSLLEKLNVLYSFAENGVMPQLREQAQKAYFGTDEEPGLITRYDEEVKTTIRLILETFLKQRAAKYRSVSDNAHLAFNLLSTRRQGIWPIKDRIRKEAEGGKTFVKDEEAFPFVDQASLTEIFPVLNAEFFKLLGELHYARLLYQEIAPSESERIKEFTEHEAVFFRFYDLLRATLGIETPDPSGTTESTSESRSELRSDSLADKKLEEFMKMRRRWMVTEIRALKQYNPSLADEIAKLAARQLEDALPEYSHNQIPVLRLMLILKTFGAKELTPLAAEILKLFDPNQKLELLDLSAIDAILQLFIELQIKDQIELVAKFLDFRNPRVRRSAVAALGKLGAVNYKDRLERVARDDSSSLVRLEAEQSLNKLRPLNNRSELRLPRHGLLLSLSLNLAASQTISHLSGAVTRGLELAVNSTVIRQAINQEFHTAEMTSELEKVGTILGNELVFADGAILLLPTFVDLFGTVVVIAPTQIEESAIEAIKVGLKPGQEIITAPDYQSARSELRKRGFTSEHVIVSETDPILTIKQWATRVTVFNKKKIGEMLSGLESAVQEIQAALRIAYAA